MNNTEKILLLALVIVVLASVIAAPVYAHSRVFFRGSFFIGPVWWGGPWWYPYPYYYPSPPVVIERPAPVYQPPVQVEEQPYYWYFCPGPDKYYPYVKECPGGWLKVVPPPAPPRGKE